MALPVVTCLCPTYGRFESLRDVVACFLLQDYPAKRLLIFDDSLVSSYLWGLPDSVDLRWWTSGFETLGHKRQSLLGTAESPLVAHWDDDDLYLPWHLSMLVEALQTSGKACVKPGAAWYATGPRDGWKNKGFPHHNVFEGQMLFDRQAALDLGGYPPLDSGQAKALLAKFGRAGQAHTWNPADGDVSYVYRWADGADHVSARRKRPSRDADWGDGQPLISDGVEPLAWARDRVESQFEKLPGWRDSSRFGASRFAGGPLPEAHGVG